MDQVYATWMRTGGIDVARDADAADIVTFVQQRLAEIEALAEEKGSHHALAALATLNAFLGETVHARRDVLDRLGDVIERFKDVAVKIGQRVAADGLTIGVGVPFGVSVSLSFAIHHHWRASWWAPRCAGPREEGARLGCWTGRIPSLKAGPTSSTSRSTPTRRVGERGIFRARQYSSACA